MSVDEIDVALAEFLHHSDFPRLYSKEGADMYRIDMRAALLAVEEHRRYESGQEWAALAFGIG